MRAYIILPIMLLVILSGVGVYGQTSDVPGYVIDHRQVQLMGYSSSGEYDGYEDIAYSLEEYNIEINDNNIALYGILKAEAYEGLVGYTADFPCAFFRVKIWGHLTASGSYTATDDTTGTWSLDQYKTFFHTIFSVYHVGGNDILYAVLKTRYIADGVLTVELWWYHSYLNVFTGKYETVEVAHVYNQTSVSGNEPIVVDIWFKPAFWIIEVVDGENKTSYLSFGFVGSIKAYTSSTHVTGNFGFAWSTKKLLINKSVDENLTITDIKNYLDDARGWYVWIGGGLKYYAPNNSPWEVFPDIDTTWEYLGSAVVDKNVSTASLDSFSYTFTIQIANAYVENWVVSPELLYVALTTGNLAKYQGAFINMISINTDTGYQIFVRTLAFAFLPLVITALILGWGYKIQFTHYLFPIFVLGTGLMMGIYGIPELAVLILGLIAIFIIEKRQNTSKVVGNEG